jgi:hypothetical protein
MQDQDWKSDDWLRTMLTDVIVSIHCAPNAPEEERARVAQEAAPRVEGALTRRADYMKGL